MSQSCRARLFFGARLIQQNLMFFFCFVFVFVFVFFFACFIFPGFFFMNLLVKIYMKRRDKPNKTLCTTDFFNSVVFFLVSCSSINQVPYFILNKVVTDPNLTRLLLKKKKKKKKKKKHALRSGLPIGNKF